MPPPMDSRRRDQIRDPREEILLETNFDDDGTITRAYNNNNQNANPSNRRRNQYRSEMSIDRFSEASLHGNNYKGIHIAVLFCCNKYILYTF